MEGIIKIDKIYSCRMCQYFRYDIGRVKKPFLDAMGGIGIKRYKCFYPDNKRKNDCYRIISRDAVNKGEIPGWCKLEDYKEVIN